jgi:hypothetical protein
MTLHTPWSVKKNSLMFGVVFLAIHSLVAVAMFLYVCSQRGIAQAELDWALFFLLDLPTSLIVFPWLISTPPMHMLFDRGYQLVGSGPNLRTFAVVVLAGGLQWFVVGCCIGVIVSWCRASRLRRASCWLPKVI